MPATTETRVSGDTDRAFFADASFDILVDFGTCYHISRPEQALSEITRVLRPGGAFVYETPLSQLLAHPVRTKGQPLPWRSAPELRPRRNAALWSSRVRAELHTLRPVA